MRIAYLILCNDDAPHINRLARRLVISEPGNAAFIHVDRKSTINQAVIRLVATVPNIHVVDERYDVFWGGFSAINATYALLRLAVNTGPFDRYVLLQGADYPIKSNEHIDRFFETYRDVEFIRAINCATSTNKYFYSKARYPINFDRRTLFERVRTKLIRTLDLRLKPRSFKVGDKTFNVYFGCAQFAITHRCAALLLRYESSIELRNHFADVFPCDETFFHTIVYNSDLVASTTLGRAECDEELSDLVDLMNLTYFEYPTSVTIFTAKDFDKINDLPHLYVRKVRTTDSSELLDMLDRRNAADFQLLVERFPS